MSETASLKSPAQIPAIVAGFLGFEPSDSLVILGLGGGPSARVDVNPDSLADAVSALTAAARHWTNGVVVALYSDTVDMLDLEHALMSDMPEVEVKALVTVTNVSGRVVVTDPNGNTYEPDSGDLPDSLRAKRVVKSRDELVAEASATTNAGEAWGVAIEAYRAGDGARAWVYLDRFHAMSAPTDDSMLLAHFLTEAVDPKSDDARELLG